jgi:predicted 3-demethylubiquinone-9 3-methyltransferase (glyoxalase superfamily)
MQKIVSHLWYDKEAKEAALFYMSLFDQSNLINATVLENTPSGDAEVVNFELAGQSFSAISAGPFFKFNPSISLMVACTTVEEVNTKWKALSEGGMELMPLGEYPFSKWYGWTQDRYGLSWQLMLVEEVEGIQKITPNLLFSNVACGKAEEAIKYYTEVFEDSEITMVSKYADGEAMTSKAKVNYAAFKLSGIAFSAMDNAFDVDYNFNEAFSIMVNCKDQEEIDYFWDKLSAVPEAEQCGWLKDKFGVSWQIVPSNLNDLLSHGSKDEIQRVTEAFLKMKKFDLEALERARLGK